MLSSNFEDISESPRMNNGAYCGHHHPQHHDERLHSVCQHHGLHPALLNQIPNNL